MKVIKYDEMLDALTKAVELKGEDYVYEMDDEGLCHYVKDGKPDCIAAIALHSLGMPVQRFLSSEYIAVDGIAIWIGDEPARMTNKAAFLIRRAQQHQDASKPWGKALAEALSYMDTLTFDEDEAYLGLKK